MDKITTPMAVLISGILISIVLYLDYSKPQYHITMKQPRSGDYLIRTDIKTGETCEKEDHPDHNEWKCY
mgnify:FL=1|tara:strand:- start:861 stop:1067 length:207 start_codon:yes stop_codon:yes gene_type:complete